ncbi:hypothetical protein [Coleofasciculus sp. E1-EBD-02]|uniref:hypothetical protein n=1 Tax=Coleofasciculus sp. E1-EBD-02 TaxID=3068481 RepID=UPI003300A2FE
MARFACFGRAGLCTGSPVRYTALGNVTLNYLKTAHKSVVSNCSFGLYAIALPGKHAYPLSQ